MGVVYGTAAPNGVVAAPCLTKKLVILIGAPAPFSPPFIDVKRSAGGDGALSV